MSVPEAVHSYIEDKVIKTAESAYLEFDDDGLLKSWGGPLTAHSIVDPGLNKRVLEVAPFLEEVVPLGGQRLVLPQVQTRANHYSDIHIFQAEGSEWVLFFDRTEENRGFQVVQQCFNELALLRDLHQRVLEKNCDGTGATGLLEEFENLTRETERLLRQQRGWIKSTSFSHILDELAIVVAQRMTGAEFRLEKCPAWFGNIIEGALCGDVIDMVENFPFLESFFEDADVIWAGHLPGSLRSGLWVEDDLGGKEVALQATALRHGDEALLLLMFPSIDYREKQEILTRARITQLEHEKLRKEIEKKEILLHCIVHDLAGPMHGIQGALDLFAMGKLDDENRHLLTLCGRQCETQQRLIQDILAAFSSEVASPKTVKIEAEKAPDALRALSNVRDTLGPSFEMRGVLLEINNEVHQGADRRVAIDSDSLDRALINLAENALRHSPRGKRVVLTLTQLASEVLITVDDEGPGVPADIRDRLFNKFSQGGDRASRGKIGLGLYFCRITAETWGGEVGQENRAEGGSRFWIRLPSVG